MDRTRGSASMWTRSASRRPGVEAAGVEVDGSSEGRLKYEEPSKGSTVVDRRRTGEAAGLVMFGGIAASILGPVGVNGALSLSQKTCLVINSEDP